MLYVLIQHICAKYYGSHLYSPLSFIFCLNRFPFWNTLPSISSWFTPPLLTHISISQEGLITPHLLKWQHFIPFKPCQYGLPLTYWTPPHWNYCLVTYLFLYIVVTTQCMHFSKAHKRYEGTDLWLFCALW